MIPLKRSTAYCVLQCPVSGKIASTFVTFNFLSFSIYFDQGRRSCPSMGLLYSIYSMLNSQQHVSLDGNIYSFLTMKSYWQHYMNTYSSWKFLHTFSMKCINRFAWYLHIMSCQTTPQYTSDNCDFWAWQKTLGVKNVKKV